MKQSSNEQLIIWFNVLRGLYLQSCILTFNVHYMLKNMREPCMCSILWGSEKEHGCTLSVSFLVPNYMKEGNSVESYRKGHLTFSSNLSEKRDISYAQFNTTHVHAHISMHTNIHTCIHIHISKS